MRDEATILFWWLMFGGTHIIGSTIVVRAYVIGKIGNLGFKAVYSFIALATFVPLCLVYFAHKFSRQLSPDTKYSQASAKQLTLQFFHGDFIPPACVVRLPPPHLQPKYLLSITKRSATLWGLPQSSQNGDPLAVGCQRGEFFGHRTAAGAGTDDHHVVVELTHGALPTDRRSPGRSR